VRLRRVAAVVAAILVILLVIGGVATRLAFQRGDVELHRLIDPWGGGGCDRYELGLGVVRCRTFTVGDFLSADSVDISPAWSEIGAGRLKADAVLRDVHLDLDRVPAVAHIAAGGGKARSIYIEGLSVSRHGTTEVEGWSGRADRLADGWIFDLGGNWHSARIHVGLTRTASDGCSGAVTFTDFEASDIPVDLPGGITVTGKLAGGLELGAPLRFHAASDALSAVVPELADEAITAPLTLDLAIPGEGCRPVMDPLGFSGTIRFAEIPATLWGERNAGEITAGIAAKDAPMRRIVDLLPRSFLGDARKDAVSKAAIEGSLSVTALATRKDGKTILDPHASMDDLVVEGLVDSARYRSGPFTYNVKSVDGSPTIRTTGEGDSDWVPLRSVPMVLRQAVLASEDASFSYNPGYSIAMIVDAFHANQDHDRVMRGGSTLTQQLVKNLLTGPERSYSRKAFELLAAAQFTRDLGKNRILELYLNIVELGPGIYGVGEAARELFGMRADQLGPAESLYLAVALPWPTRMYHEGWERKGLGPGAARYAEIRDKLGAIGALDPATVGMPRYR
jgi:hypothetical protein